MTRIPAATSARPPVREVPSQGLRVLTLNAGSSSLKFALYDYGPPLVRVLSDSLPWKASGGSSPAPSSASPSIRNPPEDLTILSRLPSEATQGSLAGIGHRVVHGGPRYREAARVDRAMLDELRAIRSFDPEHLPREISLIEHFLAHFPAVPQVACFDTSFHHALPRESRILPIPRKFESRGVQRYGFHGLSCAYLMEQLALMAGPKAANGRVILAHLGNGASMTAVRDGRSMDTTMAFTPASGLVMSTRSGDLDPGLAAFLLSHEGLTALEFNHLVNHESGLLGISETSSDVRDLLASEFRDIRAAEALAKFCYEARKQIGAYAAALGGLETLIFSGGIGENSPVIRGRICEPLAFLGIELSESRNGSNAGLISSEASRVAVRVIRTDEEQMIARSVLRLLGHEGRLSIG